MTKLPDLSRVRGAKTEFIVTIVVLVIIMAGALFFGAPGVKKLFFKLGPSSSVDIDQISQAPATDIFAPDLSGFSLKKIDLPEDHNSYYDLQKVVDSEVKTPILPNILLGGSERYGLDYYQDLNFWSEDEIEAVIMDHRSNIDNFLLAAKKEAYQNPGTADPENLDLNIGLAGAAIKRSARATALEAIWLASKGDEHLAFRHSLDIIKVGHLIEVSQAVDSEIIIGLEIKNIGLHVLQQVISYSVMPATQMSVYLWELDSYQVSENTDFIKFDVVEFQKILSEVVSGPEWELSGAEINDYSFQPNSTMAYFIEGLGENLKNYQKLCHLESEFLFSVGQAVDITSGGLKEENYVGKMLLDTTDLSHEHLREFSCDQKMHLAATQILGAVKQYLLDNNGKYPTALKQLVPNYLNELPNDPYSDNEFIYSSSDKTIRSVGQDWIDHDQIDISEDLRNTDTPIFSVKFHRISSLLLDASQVDSDGDGLNDQEEREVYGSDPNNVDSDNDGYWDGAEVSAGFNPAGDGRL